MSPNDTNLDRQTAQHKVPLAGIVIAGLFAVGLILYLVASLATTPADDGEAGDPGAAALNEGDVTVPDAAPTTEIAPDAADTTVVPAE